MQVRPSVIITDGDKILLMKYNYNGSEVYALPGGNPDEAETLEETLIRELQEELNINIAVNELVLVGEVIFREKSKSTLHCIFQGCILSGKPELNPEHTSALSLEWLPLSTAANLNMYPNVGKQLCRIAEQQSQINSLYIGQIKQNWF